MGTQRRGDTTRWQITVDLLIQLCLLAASTVLPSLPAAPRLLLCVLGAMLIALLNFLEANILLPKGSGFFGRRLYLADIPVYPKYLMGTLFNHPELLLAWFNTPLPVRRYLMFLLVVRVLLALLFKVVADELVRVYSLIGVGMASTCWDFHLGTAAPFLAVAFVSVLGYVPFVRAHQQSLRLQQSSFFQIVRGAAKQHDIDWGGGPPFWLVLVMSFSESADTAHVLVPVVSYQKDRLEVVFCGEIYATGGVHTGPSTDSSAEFVHQDMAGEKRNRLRNPKLVGRIEQRWYFSPFKNYGIVGAAKPDNLSKVLGRGWNTDRLALKYDEVYKRFVNDAKTVGGYNQSITSCQEFAFRFANAISYEHAELSLPIGMTNLKAGIVVLCVTALCIIFSIYRRFQFVTREKELFSWT